MDSSTAKLDEPGAEEPTAPGYSARGLRVGQLLALLGLTGFAISQPLLSVAGEEPTVFTLAEVRGSGIVVFALLVALVPPLVLWAVVLLVGLVRPRVADLVFVGMCGVLVGLTAVQVVKAAGLERAWMVGLLAVAAAAMFGWLLVRVDAVAMWTRFTAGLPAIAVALLLVASPTGALLEGPEEVAAGGGNGAHPSVVFIMLDEFPLTSLLDEEGQIDAVRFPNLASFSTGSTWYPNYTAMAYSTQQSVPSILSGNFPTDEPPLWTSEPDNLFTLFAPTHDLAVSERVTQLCGFTNCAGPGASDREETGVSTLLRQFSDVWRQRTSLSPTAGPDLGQFAEELEAGGVSENAGVHTPEDHEPANRPVRVTDFIEALTPGKRPSLSYLHLMLPHQPWTFYPDGEMYTGFPNGAGYAAGGPEAGTDWNLSALEQAHLMQAQYADLLVGDIIDHLQSTGLYDDSLIVITADHGIAFKNFPDLRFPHENVLGEIAYVPLLVKAPGQTEAEVDTSNLMAVDLVPTIADVAGLEPEWEVDGFPVGSVEIAERGSTKDFALPREDNGKVMDRPITFDADESRPDASDRRIGSISPGENPLGGLAASVGARHHLGTAVADHSVREGGQVTLRDEKSFRNPGHPRPGFVQGTIADPEVDSVILVGVNGTIVSVAVTDQAGAFNTLLPPGTFRDGENDLRIYQVDDDVLIELVES